MVCYAYGGRRIFWFNSNKGVAGLDKNKIGFLGRFGLGFLASIVGVISKMFIMEKYWWYPEASLQYKIAHSGAVMFLFYAPCLVLGAGVLSVIITNLFEMLFWEEHTSTIILALLIGFALSFLGFMYVGAIN
jgi:hypothetical protein